ncbi:hypothetical protein CC2G_011188 [Coprinopsis cinerea AmutBmut pab1-1]|nr:hypothetical protein CC2G_011188 [Coprinopsis cinerea AmutBmut pab1-1]
MGSLYQRNLFEYQTDHIKLYDYLQTLDQEVATVWPGRMCTGKVLFLITRYTPFIDYTNLMAIRFWPTALPPSLCHALFLVANIGAMIGVTASDGILVVSLYALLGAKRSHMIVLSIIALACIIPTLVLVGLFLKASKGIPGEWPLDFLACYYRFDPVDYGLNIMRCYYILLAGEFVITAMAVILGFRKYLSLKSPLMAILFRDGTIYFVVLLGFTTLNIVFDHFSPLAGLLNGIQRVMHAILANRLFLNTRSQISQNVDESRVLSNLKFAQTEDSEMSSQQILGGVPNFRRVCRSSSYPQSPEWSPRHIERRPRPLILRHLRNPIPRTGLKLEALEVLKPRLAKELVTCQDRSSSTLLVVTITRHLSRSNRACSPAKICYPGYDDNVVRSVDNGPTGDPT